jgi:hypothetical protein
MIEPRAILLAFALAAMSQVALSYEGGAANDSSPHYGHELGDTTPSEGESWPTDEPLRTGMSRIEAALSQATIAGRPRGSESARELVHTVEQNIAYIFEHCELPPAPDRALHMLLARMIAAANQLKDDATSDAAVAQLIGTLQDYHRNFDHWSQPSHRH